MSKRKPITERMKIDALLYRAWRKYPVFCPTCNDAIEPGQPIDWDHMTALGLGGEHHYSNLRPLHRACHRAKTSGTGATTAGSDIGKISKVKRIVRTQKMAVKKPEMSTALMAVKAADAQPKRQWLPGRKMKSRNTFQTRKRAS